MEKKKNARGRTYARECACAHNPWHALFLGLSKLIILNRNEAHVFPEIFTEIFAFTFSFPLSYLFGALKFP